MFMFACLLFCGWRGAVLLASAVASQMRFHLTSVVRPSYVGAAYRVSVHSAIFYFRNDEQESPIAAAPTCTATTHQYSHNEMFSYCICDCSDVSRFIFVLFNSMCFHTICRHSLPSTKLHVLHLPSSPSSTCQFK